MRRKFNTKCWFWQNAECTKENCPFLHEEEPVGTVFHDGNDGNDSGDVSPSPEPVASEIADGDGGQVPFDPSDPFVDARIYFRNVPATFGKQSMRQLVKQFGKVSKVDFMPSLLQNGRRSGFIHMRSKTAALNAAKEICQTRCEGVTLYAHLEKCTSIHEEAQAGSEMMFPMMSWTGNGSLYEPPMMNPSNGLVQGVEAPEAAAPEAVAQAPPPAPPATPVLAAAGELQPAPVAPAAPEAAAPKAVAQAAAPEAAAPKMTAPKATAPKTAAAECHECQEEEEEELELLRRLTAIKDNDMPLKKTIGTQTDDPAPGAGRAVRKCAHSLSVEEVLDLQSRMLEQHREDKRGKGPRLLTVVYIEKAAAPKVATPETTAPKAAISKAMTPAEAAVPASTKTPVEAKALFSEAAAVPEEKTPKTPAPSSEVAAPQMAEPKAKPTLSGTFLTFKIVTLFGSRSVIRA